MNNLISVDRGLKNGRMADINATLKSLENRLESLEGIRAFSLLREVTHLNKEKRKFDRIQIDYDSYEKFWDRVDSVAERINSIVSPSIAA